MTESSSQTIKFEPGDIVQLKSFGPAMTVIATEADGVRVLWYAESNDEVRTQVIPAIALEKITVLDDDGEGEDDDDDDEDDDHKGRKHRGKKKRQDEN
ncbi:MAG: DUF2158 domain-containing protein [Methylocella sp.]